MKKLSYGIIILILISILTLIVSSCTPPQQGGNINQTTTNASNSLCGDSNHDLIYYEAKDATCVENGWEAYEACSKCDYSTKVEIVALGHSVVLNPAKEPTCDEKGWNAYAECYVCGFNNYVELPPLSHELENGKCIRCDFETKHLSAKSNITSILIDEDSYYQITIYVHVAGGADINSIGIYDDNNNFYGMMFDDGAYSENGDELSNDKVYTLRLHLYISGETTYNFVAKSDGVDSLTSNSLTIDFISNISEDELIDMEIVDESIVSEIFENNTFDELTQEEKKTVVEEQLSVLEKQNLITEDSIIYNDETESYTFLYDSGALGAVVLNDLGCETTYEWTIDPINIITQNSTVLSQDAIILWSFNQSWDDPNYRTGFYVDTINQWNELGSVNANIDWDVTIEDYKKLSEYEIIVFSAHGTYYKYKTGYVNTELLPSIVLTERATKEKDKQYAEDLKMHRIGKISVRGGTMYTILPAFWTHYYGEGDLDGSFVFSESCEFAGAYTNIDYKMFESILSRSAETVIGFHNSVLADYSRNLMNYYINSLFAGYSAQEAFNMAKAYYGHNDYFQGRELFGPTAYPIMRGDGTSTLISSSLENGSFENPVDLLGWEYSGDVRILTQLAELIPQHQGKMAILTTGIGSGESEYLEGTEGSVMYQTFYVGSGDQTLSFSYDIVSEEPHEYVGSQFDDKFFVEIIDENGNKYILVTESVNTSVWYAIEGIDFDQGDHTTYHTGWFSKEFDISEFQGQYITIRFVTYDVGDSIYDTVALIDNVQVN